MPDDISAVLPGLHRETDNAQAYIRSIFHREMGVTLHNYRAGSSRDEAMRNLTKEAANLYAKRVLRELIQNAFDGASDAADVRILLRLDLKAGEYGTLYVANNGRGFTRDNVDAVVSPAMSNKTPGNFIGHKGLGFRSVELLSDDVQIYSILGRVSDSKKTFDGYCFRFADADDERNWLAQEDALADAPAVVGRVHRLQLPLPIDTAPSDVASYAGEGYATVIKLPLRDADAAASAAEELRLLVDGSPWGSRVCRSRTLTGGGCSFHGFGPHGRLEHSLCPVRHESGPDHCPGTSEPVRRGQPPALSRGRQEGGPSGDEAGSRRNWRQRGRVGRFSPASATQQRELQRVRTFLLDKFEAAIKLGDVSPRGSIRPPCARSGHSPSALNLKLRAISKCLLSGRSPETVADTSGRNVAMVHEHPNAALWITARQEPSPHQSSA